MSEIIRLTSEERENLYKNGSNSSKSELEKANQIMKQCGCHCHTSQNNVMHFTACCSLSSFKIFKVTE